jgi:hypothetical protein
LNRGRTSSPKRWSLPLLLALVVACNAPRPPAPADDPDAGAPPAAPPRASARGVEDARSDSRSRSPSDSSSRSDSDSSSPSPFLYLSPDSGPLFPAAVRHATLSLAALSNNRIPRHPSPPVTVRIFSSPSAYNAYCTLHFGAPCSDIWGRYERSTREITVDASTGLATLTHKLTHALVQDDFPMIPRWFDEGLGSLFEQPVFPHPGEIHGAKNPRLGLLLQTLDAGAPLAGSRADPRLAALFGMTRTEFLDPGAVDLHYALARYACMWLDAQNLLWPFYRAWRDGYWDDLTGERAFATVVNQTPRDAQDGWVHWLQTL